MLTVMLQALGLLLPQAAAACPDGAVYVEGPTTFEMGGGSRSNALPAHKVTVDGFCLDRTEVTLAAYARCVAAGKCEALAGSAFWTGITKAHQAQWNPLCHAATEANANHPVNCVSHVQAVQYCGFVHGRLPWEAEWELAARGPKSQASPWGDAPATPALLNACDASCQKRARTSGAAMRAYADTSDGFATTAPVGSHPQGSGPYGVQDLLGNVREWVMDRYGPFDATAAGGTAQTNPRGPATGQHQVTRGAGWNNQAPTALLATFRAPLQPDARHPAVGFRCAYDPAPANP